MKPSRYNLFIPQGGHGLIIFNTLTRAIVTVDRPLGDRIRTNCLNSISHSIVQRLGKLGIIVEDGVDERQIAAYHYSAIRFRSDLTRFAVVTTYNCNLSCHYCYQGGLPNRNLMNSATTDAVLEFIKACVVERSSRRLIVGLYGGEPLLNIDCCYRICDHLRTWADRYGVCLEVILTTNGTLLSREVLNRIGPLSSVHLTLDGPKALHDTKRYLAPGRHGTYDKVISVIQELKKRAIKTSVRLNIARDSLIALSTLLDDLRERQILGWPSIRVYTQFISPVCNPAVRPADLQCIPEAELDAVSDSIWSLGRIWPIERSLNNLGFCPFVNDWSFTVDPNGEIYKCPLWTGFDRYRVGILQPDGTPKWNRLYYEQMSFSPCHSSRCGDCIYLPCCGGGCPTSTLEHNTAPSATSRLHNRRGHKPGSDRVCVGLARKRKLALHYVRRAMEVNSYEAISI